MLDWDDGDRFSFDDSDRFEDSLCSWSSEPESLCNNWRGWKKPTIVANNGYGVPTKKTTDYGSTVGTLCELAARTVAAHIPFELVEHVYPPVPEQLQLRIAFWSFPDNEEDIRLYSCLANGSSEEFLRGDTLFKNRNVKDPLQIGFHLSASVQVPHVPMNMCDKYNVAVTFDRRRITSCNCTCSSTAYWCSHVVAVCLHRIHLPNEVCLRAPVSESLSRLRREQLQKFAQYLISELPQQILPTAQRLLDELLSSQPSAINSVCGAPDPTAGASVNDQTSWYLDEKTLHNNIRKIVIKFCVPAPIVFSDVNYLSTTAPPAAAEWSSLLRPLRGREPEGMWNLLSIVREMFKRNDRNAIPLLEIITKECMACDQILVWWFNTKVALHIGSAGHGGGKHSNINSNSHTSQHACASLCDEIVILWRLAALNPGLGPEERIVLRDQFKDWHRHVVLKVTKSRGVQTTMSPFGANIGGAYNKARDGAAFRSDLEVFPGFRPALEASYLDWNDYQIPGITYQGGVSRLYHCPFTCFRHGGDANCPEGSSSQVSSSQAVLNCEHPPAHHSSHSHLYYFHHHNPHLHHNGGCVGQKQRAGRVSGFTEFSYNNKRRGDILNFNLCQKNYVHGEQASRKRNNDGNRSSVSSEGFCENETDGDIMTEGDVAVMVAGRSAQVETDSQEGGGSDSSTSSSNSVGACNSASNSNGASSSSSGSRPHPKRRAEPKESKGAVRKETPRKECSVEGEAAKTAFQGQAPDGSDSTVYSFDDDLGDDDGGKSVEKSPTEEKAKSDPMPEPVPSTSGMSNPGASADAAVPSTSSAADASVAESRRPSKDGSVSSTSGSAHNSGDEYMMYFYNTKKPIPMVNVEKNSGNNDKKDDKANVMTILAGIFESVKKSSDPWDILFARAEGLHAHGHGREACILGVRLAEELLAHPPDLMIEVPPLIAKGKRKKHVNPASHQISCVATATLAKCAFLCTVLAENREHFHLAFRVGLFGLEMARPPASTKPLEVKLANQESELVALLKRIPLGHRELAMIRERAQQLRDGAFKSRGEALLPIMLASLIFDALVMPAMNRPSERCQFLSPTVRCPGDEQLGFEAAVAAMGLKANVSEADHPLLCEGTRRQRGELAVAVLVHYRDDPEKIARIMDKLLDREVHQLIKTPLHADYYTSNPPIKSQRRREEARNREMAAFAGCSGCDQVFIEAALACGTNSRPNSSTSAELDQGMAAMALSSPQTKNSVLNTSRTKESRYKGKRAYPSIPNQPSDSGAHFMCELAKTVLMKAGGSSSTSLFTQAPPANSQMGPHRALHMCAFQIGLYALGLHNCVSPNWLSRTYSSHVSWITGQAMEIGAAAISFLIDTWEGHLTPPEAVSIADRASRGCDPNMVSAAAELALSCLPHSHALNPNEIQQAILQCKDQSDLMLEQSCLTVENAAKGGGVYPEVLFQVAKYWYELYTKHSPGCEQLVESEPMPESIFTLDSNQPMIALVDAPNGAALPNVSCAQSVVVKASPQPALTSLIPVMPAPYSVAPFSYALPNLHHPAHPFTASINMNQRQVQMFITPQAFPAAQIPPYSAIPAQRNMQYFSAVSLAPNGQQTMNKNMHQGGAPAQPQLHHHHHPQLYPMQPLRPQLGPQPPQSPMQPPQQVPPMQQMQHQRPQLSVVKQVQQMPVQQVPVQQIAVQQVPVQTNQVMGGIPVPVPPMIPNAAPVQQRPQQVHRQQAYTQIQLRYLLAAYRVGMLALETLARRVHDDRPQAKYTRNPPYGEDVKWLLRISKKLGAQYLHQFCVCAVSSIVSPFVLHDVALETGQYLSRHNPSVQMQHLRSALTPLVQKCQQMYIQCLHQKLYHLISGDYEEFVNIVCSARAAFQITPEGNQQFKEWLQSIRRSKSCKKDLWTQINAALQSNSK